MKKKTKKSDLKSIKICEHALEIDEMVDSLEEAYLSSCKLNKVDTKNIEYFRRYIWVLIAQIFQSMPEAKTNEP